MDSQKIGKLADLFDHDLSGWKITECHFLELEHDLMGTFPAVNGDDEIIATLDKSLLEKVWKKLKRRPAMVSSFMVIACPVSGIAFNIESYIGRGDTEPLRIFSAEAIDALCQKEGSVRWAPGLFQSKRPVYDPVFV